MVAVPFLLLSGCGADAPENVSPPPQAAMPATDDASSAKSDEALPPVTMANAESLKKLLDEAKGRVVVVNLWATWCPPCVEEMPYFVELFTKYKDKPLTFISVTADAKDTLESAVLPFQKKQALPFPIYLLDERDPDALTSVFGKELSGALPETLIYDKSGALKKVWEGEVTLAELEAEIGPLL